VRLGGRGEWETWDVGVGVGVVNSNDYVGSCSWGRRLDGRGVSGIGDRFLSHWVARLRVGSAVAPR